MSTVSPFRILQTEYTFLKSNLVLKGTRLLDRLYEENVLTPEQMEDIRERALTSEKIETLLAILMKRPARDFQHFMEGLEGDQDHIKEQLENFLEKTSSEETVTSDAEMMEDHDSMDQDTDEDSEEDSTGSEGDAEEHIGQPLKQIKDFKMVNKEQDVTLHVKVIKTEQVEEKSNKKQFMGIVADATSAVDVCVRNEQLFDKFQPKACIILRNVTWNGKVLFTKDSSTATFASEIQVPENIVDTAFGKGEPVPIADIYTQPDMSWITLRGKIVKLSPLIKWKCNKKVLSYCQVKLKDDTGFVYMDVWADIAEHMKLGGVVQINSCKKRLPLNPDDPPVTSTPKSSVKCLPASELKHILKDHQYQKGKLEGIDVTIYMSCPNPKCFHFQLTDMLCESCLHHVPVKDQVSYVKAAIDILTPKGNIRSLTVYWPELCQLFRLFKKKTLPKSDKGKIVDSFKDLGSKSVKYKACGIVSKFKL